MRPNTLPTLLHLQLRNHDGSRHSGSVGHFSETGDTSMDALILKVGEIQGVLQWSGIAPGFQVADANWTTILLVRLPSY